MILSCQNISKSFGEKEVLRNVSFQMEPHDRTALIGSNGCGKSTLLKIIMGQMKQDDGTVVFAKDVKVGYLAQYQDDEAKGTIYEIVMDALKPLIAREKELRHMEEEMSSKSGKDLETLLEEYHRLSDEFDRMGGYTYRSEVTGVLKGLGFREDEFDKTVTELSGGQKTRVFLGRLLVSHPDILILDEPINHLDLHSIQWLEGFLANYQGAVLLVAHDRYFLDRIIDHVVDLSNHSCHVYRGNYTQFVQQKSEVVKTLEREYENQQKAIEHQQEVITKLKSFNREKSIKRAESREKMLSKMDVIERPEELDTAMKLTLEPDHISGKNVLEVTNLSKGFDGTTLFSDVNFLIRRGERVGIIGDNGTGKTTLLKIINGRIKADSGTIRLGSNVTIGYYDQAQQELDDSKTLFQEMQDAYPNLNDTRIRNVLAAFLFTGDDVFKLISALSGGERGRVSLAKLMLSGANFLILDEPTNHLDMESKEILENALKAYTGTLLYVSHDRYFINQTATRILELEDESFHEYLGNYDYYLDKKREQTEEAASEENASSEVTEQKLDWEAQKKAAAAKRKHDNAVKEVEDKISELEARSSEIIVAFEVPENATNSAKLNKLSQEQADINDQLEKLYEQWESLSEEAEN